MNVFSLNFKLKTAIISINWMPASKTLPFLCHRGAPLNSHFLRDAFTSMAMKVFYSQAENCDIRFNIQYSICHSFSFRKLIISFQYLQCFGSYRRIQNNTNGVVWKSRFNRIQMKTETFCHWMWLLTELSDWWIQFANRLPQNLEQTLSE